MFAPKVCCRYYALCLPSFLGFGVVFFMVLAGCAVWPLGRDPVGSGLEREGERVAVAIRAYRDRNGASPSSIAELVSDFLAQAPDPRVHFDSTHNQISFAYSPFLGIGKAVCATAIDVIAWHCVGFL